MKKYKPKQGDVFRYLITPGEINNGFTIFGYGRVLDQSTAAFYSNNALPPRKVDETPTLENVLVLDVAFVVGCTYDGFDTGLYEVMENVELETKFKEPIYFYHRAVASNMCNIFDIWDSSIYKEVPIGEVPMSIERWGAYSHIHIEKRLGIYREKAKA
jgi:hypothetical protein